jgi:hypothetical protein
LCLGDGGDSRAARRTAEDFDRHPREDSVVPIVVTRDWSLISLYP